MARSTIPVLAFISFVASSQTHDVKPAFEVASVKAAVGSRVGPGGPGCDGGPGTSDPRRLRCNAISLGAFISKAYQLRNYQFSPPDWMWQAFFDIEATIPSGATAEQVRLMEEGLLAERFHLVVHFERKQVPTLALIVASSGIKLKQTEPEPSSADGSKPGDFQSMDGRVVHKGKESIQEFTDYLIARTKQPVIDETALKGIFEITLEYYQDPPGRGRGGRGTASEVSDPKGGPDIFSAIQSQLGLKLEPKKTMVDVLVVDHAEKVPTEN
jgi:uncharacterized protein (TIGR03435 family)